MIRFRYIAVLLFPVSVLAQTEFVINNGTDVRVNPGCQVIFAEGGIQNVSGEFSNAGEVVVEGNVLNSGTLSGNGNTGILRVLNDIENNGTMVPGEVSAELYGDAQFLLGSQQLNFFDLTLTGSGIKYMQQNISTAGTLDLTDRELRAATNTVFHANPAVGTVLAEHDAGFVSADAGGGLSRVTSGRQAYYYPVGSTVNNFKIRPVTVTPDGGDNIYKVRYVPGPTPNATQRGPELYYVNPIFYHRVEVTDGFTPGTVTIYYDDTQDGLFETLASIESNFWRENVGTIEGPTLGSSPELKSFETPNWDFGNPDIALAALAKEIFVPNVFSPNNDGQNDVFKPRGTEPFEYELRIYDRWGNLVFSSTEFDVGWDGTMNGTAMNSAVFVYYILSGGTVMDKGNVTLVR